MTREREAELRAWAADLHAPPTQYRAEMREVFAALDEARESHEIDRMLLTEAHAGWKRALDERDALRAERVDEAVARRAIAAFDEMEQRCGAGLYRTEREHFIDALRSR